jgi:hypothetical protein
MIVVGAAVSYEHRQPNPASAIGAATYLAKLSVNVAARDGRPVVTAKDVQNAITELPKGPSFNFGFDLGIDNPHLVVVNAGHQHACVYVSLQARVAPRAEACPVGTSF